jgi:hypothetical protein
MATYDRRTASVPANSMLGVEMALMGKLVKQTQDALQKEWGVRTEVKNGYTLQGETKDFVLMISYDLLDNGVVGAGASVRRRTEDPWRPVRQEFASYVPISKILDKMMDDLRKLIASRSKP